MGNNLDFDRIITARPVNQCGEFLMFEVAGLVRSERDGRE